MREHKYKAKRLDNGEWIEGYYWQNGCGNHFIRAILDCDKIVIQDYEIDPKTLCEFTGLYNKNKNMIYEHDIVQYPSSGYKQEVKYGIWDECGYFYEVYGWDVPSFKGIEVIGNIFDNPELLELN